MAHRVKLLGNGVACYGSEVPCLPGEEFQQILSDALTAGVRLSAYFGQAVPYAEGKVLVTAVLANDGAAHIGLLRTIADGSLPSLSSECPEVQLFERELREQFSVEPIGHPWLKPVRFERRMDRLERGGDDTQPPGATPFFAVKGEEVHEVAVGPVHAGIIEPGHFRFQCHGERVFHLEISLGYQHRGIERLLVEEPRRRTMALCETIAGDTAVGHAVASARAQEALSDMEAPPRAYALRAIALELERLANHVGDLGALANDVGYLPTASYCGALRAEYLNALAEICGNRFGRGLVVPGGVRFDVPDDAAGRLADRLDNSWAKVEAAAGLFFHAPSVQNRTEEVGVVSPENAKAIGLVGPVARASGVPVDVRYSHPFPPYTASGLKPITASNGDVAGRATVRFEEARVSAGLVSVWLRSLPAGQARSATEPIAPNRIVVSLVEGWRGEICHVVTTGADGRFSRYKVVDPSFHNWKGLELAMRGEQISDFPLCNKSFNLSYCGHDL